MPRPFSEKIRDEVWWLEQAAHAWIGAGLALVSSGVSSLFAPEPWIAPIGIIAAGVGGATREVVQNWGDEENDVLDSIADTIFTTLGGVIQSVPYWIAFA